MFFFFGYAFFPDKPNFLFFLSSFFLFRAIGRHLVRRILQRFHPYHAIVERQFDSLDIQRRRSRRHQRGRPLNVPVVNNTQHKRNEYFDLFKTERTPVLLLAFIQLYHSYIIWRNVFFFFIFFYFIYGFRCGTNLHILVIFLAGCPQSKIISEQLHDKGGIFIRFFRQGI